VGGGDNSCIYITCRFIRHRVSSGVLSVGCVEIRDCKRKHWRISRPTDTA